MCCDVHALLAAGPWSPLRSCCRRRGTAWHTLMCCSALLAQRLAHPCPRTPVRVRNVTAPTHHVVLLAGCFEGAPVVLKAATQVELCTCVLHLGSCYGWPAAVSPGAAAVLMCIPQGMLGEAGLVQAASHFLCQQHNHMITVPCCCFCCCCCCCFCCCSGVQFQPLWRLPGGQGLGAAAGCGLEGGCSAGRSICSTGAGGGSTHVLGRGEVSQQ
jgi:hypothetical protein